jgi:hypothetical protein
MPGPDDEIRCLSLGETLGKTLYIFFNRADVFLTLALMVTLPVFLSTVLFLSSLAGVNNDTDPWEYLSLHWPSLLSYLLFQGLLSVVLYFSCEAAMVRAAAEIHAGRSPEWYPCMGQGFGQFSSLVCARLLVWFLLLSTLALDVGLCVALAESAPMMSNRYVLVTLLSIAYLGASFTLWTTTMILYPVIIVEKKGPVAALRRSFELARGLRCYFFCSALCLWIIKLFVVALLQNIFLSSNVASLISVAGVAITSMGSLVGLPLFTMYVRGPEPVSRLIGLVRSLHSYCPRLVPCYCYCYYYYCRFPFLTVSPPSCT